MKRRSILACSCVALMVIAGTAVRGQNIAGDAVLRAGAYYGTDNSPAIEQQICKLAPPPWGNGQGGTLRLPAGLIGITRPILLPRTMNSPFNDLPSQAVRVEGEGPNTTTLVYLGEAASKHDFVIGWDFCRLPVAGFTRSDDGQTWVHFTNGLFKHTCFPPNPTMPTRYHVLLLEGETAYAVAPAEYKILEKDLAGGRVKINTPFLEGSEKQKPQALVYVRTLDQRIAGLRIVCPRKAGAVGIYYPILSQANWRTHAFTNYNYSSVNAQVISLDLFDVDFVVRAEFNPACVRVEGSWFGSTIENIRCFGKSGPPRHYDTYLLDCDWELPEGRGDVPARVSFDANGLQNSFVRNAHGNNFSAFRGRMNGVVWEGGFYAGGGRQEGREETTGLPVWCLKNSRQSQISFVGHEGHAEKPAEFYCENSAGIVVRYYTGGGAEPYPLTTPPDLELGDMIRFKNCWNCGVEKRIANGKSYGFQNRIQAKNRSSNPGQTALLRMIDCTDCYADGLDLDVLPPAVNDPFRKDLAAMVNLMIRIDDASTRNGCYARGTVWITEGMKRLEKHIYELRGGLLAIDAARQ